MKKILLMMVAAAAMLAATSCTEDTPVEQARKHYYTISTNDHSWGRGDMAYLFDHFPDDVRMFTIEGTTADADAQALKRYNDILDQVDDDYVCSQFPCFYDEDLEEYLYAEVDLLRTEGVPDTLARRRWTINGVE